MVTSIADAIRNFFRSFQPWIIICPWEQGIRVRLGKHRKTIGPGVHLKIPIADKFFVQSIRTRICTLQKQTVTSKDGKTITVCGNVGYCIENIEKLYNSLHHAEDTLASKARNAIAEYIFTHNIDECRPEKVQEEATKNLNFTEFGIGCSKIYITEFAVVRTYRIIGDTLFYGPTSLNTETPSTPN